MNKTDQQKNNKYINYWTKSGDEAKKYNQSTKLEIAITYKDKNGIGRARTTFRHPTLKDLTFKEPLIVDKRITEEQKAHHKELESERKAQKAKRFEDLKFSFEHYKLLGNMYGKSNNIAKQQARIAAHESKIANIMAINRAKKVARTINYNAERPNLLIIRRIDSEGKPYAFSTIPSSKTLEELRKDAMEMLPFMEKNMEGFFSIEVWEKEEYLKVMRHELGNCRYCIYAKNKKLAA